MSEFRHLLHDAAGEPPRPLNMAAVRERAARIGAARRLRFWLITATGVLGLAVPVTGALVTSGSEPSRVETIDDDRDDNAPQPEPAPDASRDARPGRIDDPVDAAGSPQGATGGGDAGLPGAAAPVPGAGSPAEATSTGGDIAYVRGGEGGGIYVANSTGTRTSYVGPGQDPAWSPDGTRLAFFECQYYVPFVGAPSCNPESGVMVMNADGSEPRKLTDGFSPAWSPDGTVIAFVRGGSGIRTIRPDGGGDTAVPNTEGVFGAPSWSPDGTRLAFSQAGDIYVVGVDGSGLHQLTAPTSGSHLDPAWSPDGARIAFVATDGATVDADRDVYTVRVDGTDVQRLTSDERSASGRTQGHELSPTWTPDGQIIWVEDPGDPGQTDSSCCFRDLHIMNADGSGQRFLLNGESPSVSPRRR